MPRLIIANIDYLVTVDPIRRIIPDGALIIQDGRIAAVGKTAEFPSNPGDDVIDGRGKLALPGVFDTHVHNSQQLGRSCGDEAYSGPERLFRRLWPVEAHMDKGDALCAARLAQLEMIRAGTTCFADPGSYFSAETAQAVKESGMRGMIARTVFDMGQTTMGNLPRGFFEPTDEALVRADEMVAEFEGALDGRLKAWFSIRVPVAMSDDLLRRLGKLAEKRGVGIIGHACENLRTQYRRGIFEVSFFSRPEASNPLINLAAILLFSITQGKDTGLIVGLPSGATEVALGVHWGICRFCEVVPSLLLLPVSLHSAKLQFAGDPSLSYAGHGLPCT
jgi:cytosine/adenosine deaminase-related metal-dependent hydrolase